MQLFPKIPSGMANSVDLDQTAPLGADQTAPLGAVLSGSTLFAYSILSDTLDIYRNCFGFVSYLSSSIWTPYLFTILVLPFEQDYIAICWCV